MNIWLRLKNRATLVALIPMVITIVYTLLGFFGITPGVSEDALKNFGALIVELLVTLGIVVDPTTAGIRDSALAMSYDEPRDDREE